MEQINREVHLVKKRNTHKTKSREEYFYFYFLLWGYLKLESIHVFVGIINKVGV